MDPIWYSILFHTFKLFKQFKYIIVFRKKIGRPLFVYTLYTTADVAGVVW